MRYSRYGVVTTIYLKAVLRREIVVLTIIRIIQWAYLSDTGEDYLLG